MLQVVLIEINTLEELLELSASLKPTTMANQGELIISKNDHDEYWQIEAVDDWR
jgi:hypothetical protein